MDDCAVEGLMSPDQQQHLSSALNSGLYALPNTHMHQLTHESVNSRGRSGIGSVCASCLLTAPLGLVKFDLMAFSVN